jgi:hypothetical protein
MANLSTLLGVNDIRIYKNFQEWTTPGTYTFTVPAGITQVRAIVIGGGGGGGASPDGNYRGGDGGSGGGFAMGEYTVTPGQSITVTVGARGQTPETVALEELLHLVHSVLLLVVLVEDGLTVLVKEELQELDLAEQLLTQLVELVDMEQHLHGDGQQKNTLAEAVDLQDHG